MWKRKSKEAQAGKITKGGTSGFVISLVIHAALFLLAGLLVVFTVQQKEEKKFVPPAPVERPKMQLKKPKVKVKKTTKPKTTQRIVTKMKSASMPAAASSPGVSQSTSPTLRSSLRESRAAT